MTGSSRLLATAAITTVAAAACAVGALGALVAPAAAAPSTAAVLTEVYGGGGNSGATYANDFVEVANRGAASISLAGWSVQYLPASPSSSSQWSVTALTGSVAAGAVYLIGEASGGSAGSALPPTQASGTTNLAAASGTVALVSSTAALTCKTASTCATAAGVVDLVGYGSAVVHEGAADAPAASNTTSVQRAAATDSDNNGADFTAAAPGPGTAAGSGGGGAGTRIHDIQGTAWLSPLNGKSVSAVPGVVTGVRTAGSKGFWMQDPTPDSNSDTSEGVFVYTSTAPTVAAGDSVQVSGTVSEYYPLNTGETTSTTSQLSVTEITAPTVTVVSHGNALPAPVVLSSSNVPATYAPDLSGGNIESTPITRTRSALDFYESLEGMRVEADNARVVGPSDSYGEQYVTVRPTQNRTYRGGTELQAENATPSGRLEVVPANGSNPGVSVGDVFSGATVGPIDYSKYGGYLIAATSLGTVTAGNLAPVVATAPGSGQLSIATYNVENLAPSDAASKYTALAQGVVSNLASPDIIAVEEIQDNSGATDDGTVAADQTIGKLTAAISAAGGPSYSYREIDPVNDQDGGQPGGNIRVVFLFNPARVSFVDSGSASTNRSTTGTQVVNSGGQPALTLSPGRIDPGNSVWSSSRKPLVGEFSFNGKQVFVIGNHFDAKLGDQNGDGRYQYPAQSSATQRVGQAQAVHAFVGQLLAINPSAEVVVVGDLNDFQFSPSLAELRTGTTDGSGTATLTDLISTLPVNEQYTYVYRGVSQVLDHILTTSGVQGITYQVVHVNSEFAAQTSDHDPQVVDVTP